MGSRSQLLSLGLPVVQREELVNELATRLRLLGSTGDLTVADTIFPVVSLAELENRSITVQPPTLDPQIVVNTREEFYVNSGVVANPVVGQVLISSGALDRGKYFLFANYVTNVILGAAVSVRSELQSFRSPTARVIKAFNEFNENIIDFEINVDVSVDDDEIRWVSGSAVARNVQGIIIGKKISDL